MTRCKQALYLYFGHKETNRVYGGKNSCNETKATTIVFSACPAPIVLVIVSIGGYEAMILNSTSGKITRM